MSKIVKIVLWCFVITLIPTLMQAQIAPIKRAAVQVNKQVVTERVRNEKSHPKSKKGKIESHKVLFSCNIDIATLFIDGVPYNKWEGDSLRITGSHFIRVTAKGYKDFASFVFIDNNTNRFDIFLKKNELDTKYIYCKGIEICMKQIKGDLFCMGGKQEDKYLSLDELPEHLVEIGDYYISQTEVTQELWEAVMGNNRFNGGHPIFTHKNAPVDFVSWQECHVFIDRLNRLTGESFRLPTEAEWEYAATEGEFIDYERSIDSIAWYSGNSANRPHIVATRLPNNFELYDMIGNMSEWCEDCYTDYCKDNQINPCNTRYIKGYSVRGGSWASKIENCRGTTRSYNVSGNHIITVGLRLVLQTESQKKKAQKMQRLEYVDLGLSMCWAKNDIGASSPIYSGKSYTYDESAAAIDNIGEGWSLPTDKQMNELLYRCKWEKIKNGDNKTYKVTGPSGNHILINYISDNDGLLLLNKNSYNRNQAMCLEWNDSRSNHIIGIGSENNKYRIRPVCLRMVYVGEKRDKVIMVKGIELTMKHVTGIKDKFGTDSIKSYYIAETETTQELWKKVMGSNKSHFKNDDNPVESVSWEDCIKFIKKLNRLTGYNFRLPTVFEWLYAAKGGRFSHGFKFSGDNNINNVGWHGTGGLLSGSGMNAMHKTHVVGLLSPNELAIYDMTGNVCEWTSDIHDPIRKTRFICGGSWFHDEKECGIYNFDYAPENARQSFIGFRLVLDE